MLIGVPKEIKTEEYRVALIPATVSELASRGHDIAVESGAGNGAGISDDEYAAAGARIYATAERIYEEAELIVKVKEPLASERKKLRRGQMIFTYLHLAPGPEQAKELLSSGVTAIAYETVTDPEGKLPLLAPMSKVAGRMAIQVAAHFLERPQGGRGILLGGVDGVASGKVAILGGGVVGSNAAKWHLAWELMSPLSREALERFKACCSALPAVFVPFPQIERRSRLSAHRRTPWSALL